MRESPAGSRTTGPTMDTPEQLPANACLFLDVDGTLIDIAPTPQSVVVPPELRAALPRAAERLRGALALVSGRSIADLDRLFPPGVPVASGVHGAEFRTPDRPGAVWSHAEPIADRTREELAAILSRFPGTLAEDKAYSFAAHYRATPQSGPALREALEQFLTDRPHLGLQILPGHFVFEMKRPGIDKGAAVSTLMRRPPFAGRTPIFIGDDVTDRAGFAVVKATGGKAYSVGRPFPEVDGMFAEPAAVRAWLARFADEETRPA